MKLFGEVTTILMGIKAMEIMRSSTGCSGEGGIPKEVGIVLTITNILGLGRRKAVVEIGRMCAKEGAHILALKI